jgi:hypothetical protein
MDRAVTLVCWALLIFQLKHFVCDFVLQSPWMVARKGVYGHPGGLIHAGLHCLGSLPALLVLSSNAGAIAALLFGEFVIHYHSDWGKAQSDSRYGLSESGGSAYWIVFGLDQLIHQLTYLAMIFLIFHLGWART